MIRVIVQRRVREVRDRRYVVRVDRNGTEVAFGIGSTAQEAMAHARWDFRRWLYRQGKLELSRMVGYR